MLLFQGEVIQTSHELGDTELAKDARVSTLREIFRHLQVWRSVYESTGMDSVVCPKTKTEWSIYDIERFILLGFPKLTPRQSQAIQLCLIEDKPERTVAGMMHVSLENPVGMYATDGIKALLKMLDKGEL